MNEGYLDISDGFYCAKSDDWYNVIEGVIDVDNGGGSSDIKEEMKTESK